MAPPKIPQQPDRFITPLKYLMPRLRRGEFVNVFLDTETTGLDRQNVPYATTNYSAITEFAMTYGDLHGNHYKTTTLFPRVPDRIEGEIGAMLTAREGYLDWKSEERISYPLAMAAIVQSLREQAGSYADIAKYYGDEARKVTYRYYNKNFGPDALQDEFGRKYEERSAFVYDVPALDYNGEIVFPAFADPNHNTNFVHFDRSSRDQSGNDILEYAYEDNGFAIDMETGRHFKGLVPVNGVIGQNIKPYDLKVIKDNLIRTGFSSRDSSMLTTSARRGAKLEPKWVVYDARDLFARAMKYGPKDDNSFKQAYHFDDKTGRIRLSEKQGDVITANTNVINPKRLISQGISDPRDGSFVDLEKLHGAAYDTATGWSAYFAARRSFPELGYVHDLASNPDTQHELLKRQNANDEDNENWSLYALPIPGSPTKRDGLYFYIGDDKQLGDMGQHLFVRIDIPLFVQNPEKALRLEKEKEMNLPLPLDFIRNQGHGGDDFADLDPVIKANLKYIGENPEFIEGLKTQTEENNRQLTRDRTGPQLMLTEDEARLRNAASVNFLDISAAFRDQKALAAGNETRNRLDRTRDFFKEHIQSEFDYLTKVSNSIMDLCGRPFMVAAYNGHDNSAALLKEVYPITGKPTPAAISARKNLREYKAHCEHMFANVLKEQNAKPYVALLKSIKRANEKPFFVGNRFMAEDPTEAYEFHKLLRQRILEDLVRLMKDNPNHSFLQGVTSKDDLSVRIKDKKNKAHQLLLLPDPNPGEKQGYSDGAPPFITDKKGREVSWESIAQMAADTDNGAIIERIVDTQEWSINFHAFRSLHFYKTLINNSVDMGEEDLVPEELMPIYWQDYIYRKLGVPNTEVSDSPIPTLKTQLREARAISMAAADPRVLQRAPEHIQNLAGYVMQHEEGPRVIAEMIKGINKEIRKVEKQKENLRKTGFGRTGKKGRAYDYIEDQIDRDTNYDFLNDPNYVVLDLPVQHALNPIENVDPSNGLKTKGVVIPDIPAATIRDINKGKRVLFRVPETGQYFSGGIVSIAKKKVMQRGGMSEIFRQASQHYSDAGQDLDERSSLFFAEITDLFPLVGKQEIDYRHQSLRLPHLRWYGTTAHGFAGFQNGPITTVIAPADYVQQKFEFNKPLLLRHSLANSFAAMTGNKGEETGHVYQTKLLDAKGIDKRTGEVTGITVGEFESAINDSTLESYFMEGAGLMSAQHFNTMRREWTSPLNITNPESQKIVALHFARVNADYSETGYLDETLNQWSFGYLERSPHSALRINGKQISPGAYKNSIDL